MEVQSEEQTLTEENRENNKSKEQDPIEEQGPKTATKEQTSFEENEERSINIEREQETDNEWWEEAFLEENEENRICKKEDSAEQSEMDIAEARSSTRAPTDASDFQPTSSTATPAVASPRDCKIKKPRLPIHADRKFTTEHYELYQSGCTLTQTSAGKFAGTFEIYDDFKLILAKVQGKVVEIADIPTHGVRLDDLLVAKVLESGSFTKPQLHGKWPAEFDLEGMVRARRIPLGYAAKRYVEAGEKDVDGNIVQPGEEGYYYKWWGGLHCLMGKEGQDKGLYMTRPSFEKFKIRRAMGFKIDSRAVIQKPEGED
ncbi:MAG: hypothetical protein Q9214_004344 [Letrouitia sp. 1 TL-2023]